MIKNKLKSQQTGDSSLQPVLKTSKAMPKPLAFSLAAITFAASSSAIALPVDHESINTVSSLSELITHIEEKRQIVSADDASNTNAQSQNNRNTTTTITRRYPDAPKQTGKYTLEQPTPSNKYPTPNPSYPNNTSAPSTPTPQKPVPNNPASTTPAPAPITNNDQATVEDQVNHEIDDQTHSDANSGQAVASASTTNDDAIDSIENKNGKSYSTTNLSSYAKRVNNAVWSPNMRKNTAMTVKLQTYLDWNHASPGPIDGGWGMNSKKALANFQTMRGLPSTGRMSEATWKELNKHINPKLPVLIQYTLTDKDVRTKFTNIPSGSEAKSKLSGLYYQNIKEMLAERFHMDVRYLSKLNKGKKFKAGDKITVINVGKQLATPITRVVAIKKDEMLYAYNGNQLVATYPTTVGSSSTPSPSGTYKIVNRVKMPWYKATVGEDDEDKKVFMLPPGPNNPVGVVWMGLSKPSYGIHGSPIPEGISRQASHGCIRLTNWDVLEVFANIKHGAKVELK